MNSLTRIPSPGSDGIYIIEIKSGPKRYVGKVIVNNGATVQWRNGTTAQRQEFKSPLAVAPLSR